MSANKKIKSLTSFAGTHTRRAASPLCPTCLRPLLKSYAPFPRPLRLAAWSIIEMESLNCEKEFEKDVVL